MKRLLQSLDFQNKSELLLASAAELQKVKIKDQDITDASITAVYTEAAQLHNLKARTSFEDLMKQINSLKHFNTGVDELDQQICGIASDEIVEVCGGSGSGKTYFLMKFVSLALTQQQDVAVVYIDTTNYINQQNMAAELRNHIGVVQQDSKQIQVQQALGRLRIIKIFDPEELIILLTLIVSQLRNGKCNFDLRLIVIDSLSSLLATIPTKNQQQHNFVCDLVYYLKILSKEHFIGIVYANNTRDANTIRRVADVKNLVGEPLTWAADKQIYASELPDGQTSYVIIKH